MNFWNTIVFSFLFSSILSSQDYYATLQFADQKYLEGNYELALKTYQRLAFFNDSSDPGLFIKVADLAFVHDNFDLAQANYGFAYNQTENDSLKRELIFKKAYCQMLDHKYEFAIIDLLTLDDTIAETKQRVNFYLGTCYFGLEDFEQSKSYFKECIDPAHHYELEKLFSKKSLFSPNPKKARIMSTIFPGTGQFYSGYYRDGINSFFLSATLIGIFVNSINTYNPLYAIVTVMPWFQRYYTGGFLKSERLAQIKRQNNRNKTYNRILKLINS
ncbi:MAG: hypothetical protein ACM3PT_05100 [Deltaproteobacteria bacterium]